MSFASVFGNILGGIQTVATNPLVKGAVTSFVPGAGAVYTFLDPIFHAPLTQIVSSEVVNPASGNGAQKLDQAILAFGNQDYIQYMQAIASKSNLKVVWDDASLKEGLSKQADVYNLFAKVKDSIKLVPADVVKVP